MQIFSIIGQVLFGAYWINAGFGHLKNSTMLSGYAASKKIPAPKVAVIGTGILLVLAGLGVILGVYVTYSLIGIIIFLIPTSIMMHNFWADTDPNAKMSNQINFFKNLALFSAALILLSLAGNWPWSI